MWPGSGLTVMSHVSEQVLHWSRVIKQWGLYCVHQRQTSCGSPWGASLWTSVHHDYRHSSPYALIRLANPLLNPFLTFFGFHFLLSPQARNISSCWRRRNGLVGTWHREGTQRRGHRKWISPAWSLSLWVRAGLPSCVLSQLPLCLVQHIIAAE